jgi:hypothetical protein
MLFLAVFCGFLAENYREHIVEHKKEKEYIQAMIEDLKVDTAQISKMTGDCDKNVARVDSLIHMLRRKDRNNFGQTMYYFARVIPSTATRFELNDRTYDQMKSSGSLRLISDASVSDSVSKYYGIQATLKQQEEIQLSRMSVYGDFAGKVFDGSVFQEMLQVYPFKINPPVGNPQLITEDKSIISEYLGRLHNLGAILAINSSRAKLQKDATVRLIQLLQKKYHLE